MAGMARIILADIIAYRLFPFARFGDHMDQAHIVHFLGAINLATQDHSFSMNMADATGENVIGAYAGEQAEEDFRQTEAGLTFSDDDIERHQRLEHAAQRVALGQANVDNVHVVTMPALAADFDPGGALL